MRLAGGLRKILGEEIGQEFGRFADLVAVEILVRLVEFLRVVGLNLSKKPIARGIISAKPSDMGPGLLELRTGAG
jgi:hypothetical protein